jgi:hypothetical protein
VLPTLYSRCGQSYGLRARERHPSATMMHSFFCSCTQCIHSFAEMLSAELLSASLQLRVLSTRACRVTFECVQLKKVACSAYTLCMQLQSYS